MAIVRRRETSRRQPRCRRDVTRRRPCPAGPTLAYDLSHRHPHGLLAGVVPSAGVENLLNRTPPLFAEAHREYYSTIGDLRLRRFQVGASKAS